MNGLERAIATLNAYSYSRRTPRIDSRLQLVVTIAYIVLVVSVPVDEPDRLVWLLCYPIIMAEALGVGYWRVLRASLVVLPLIAVVAIFNPLIDRTPFWQIGSVTVSRGWVTFGTVVLRGLMSVQALMVLVRTCGFNDMCRAFARLGVPRILVTQLQMLYRYITVLLQEALTMQRARASRGYGRRSYPLRMWATFAGQLLLRSVARARRVDRAMVARGYTGTMPACTPSRPLGLIDWLWAAAWLAALMTLRFCNFSEIFNRLLQ